MKQIKDIIINNQIQNLSSLFIMLHSSLCNTIVQRRDGPADVVPSNLGPAVRGATEVALISVCNRIEMIASNAELWNIDNTAIDEYSKVADSAVQAELNGILAMLMQPDEVAESKPVAKKRPRKKGGSEQK